MLLADTSGLQLHAVKHKMQCLVLHSLVAIGNDGNQKVAKQNGTYYSVRNEDDVPVDFVRSVYIRRQLHLLDWVQNGEVCLVREACQSRCHLGINLCR